MGGFALSLALSLLGAIVHPASATLVCSPSGQLRYVSLDDAPGSTAPMSMGECALCVALLPPPPAVVEPPLPVARRSATVPDEDPRAPQHAAAPPPARGPPPSV
jgi:hypothetical protein